MKTKNGNRNFFRVLIILFIVFMGLYIAMQSGYYDATLRTRVELTEERILQFEQDVRDGKAIDINNYIEDDFVDFSSRTSKLGMNLSNSTEKFMTRGISSIFKFLGSLFS